MSHPITQHKISTEGEIVDYLRNGSKTILDSLEFDLSVARDREGKQFLQIGHPVDVRGRKQVGLPPIDANEFFSFLSKISANQIVIDVKALRWDDSLKKAIFDDGDIEFLLQELPKLIQQYQESVKNEPLKTEVIVGSVHDEFFGEAKRQGTGLDAKTRFFARATSADPFAEAAALGVDQVGLEFKAGISEARIEDLKKMAEGTKYKDDLSFYVVDDPEAARLITEHFPNAELISNVSPLIEELNLPREPKIL